MMTTRLIFILFVTVFLDLQVVDYASADAAVASALQDEIGLPVTASSFSNWAGIVTRDVVYVVRPSTIEDVQQIVRVARKYALKVRASASKLSWSSLFPDEDQVLVDMSLFQASDEERMVLSHATYYRQFPTITVSASVTLNEAKDFLLENGITFLTGPTVDDPNLVGMTATGTRGFNWRETSFSSYLTSVQIVTGAGEIRLFDADREPEFLRLYHSHLGMCGIVTRATFRVAPYPLMRKYTGMSFRASKALFTWSNVNKLLRDNEDVSITWNVFSSLTEDQKRYLDAYLELPEGVTWKPGDDHVTVRVIEDYGQADVEIMDAVNDETRFKVSYSLGDGSVSDATLQYGFLPGIQQDGSARGTTPKYVHTEFVFTVGDRLMAQTQAILTIVTETLQTWIYEKGTTPIRNVTASWWHHDPDCYLCHSAVADQKVNKAVDYEGTQVLSLTFEYLSSDLLRGEAVLQKVFQALKEEDILTLPHWASHHSFLVDIYSYIRTALRPLSKDFFKYRIESNIDSLDMFTNQYLDWVFALSDDPSGQGDDDDDGDDIGSGAEGGRRRLALGLAFQGLLYLVGRCTSVHC